MVQILASLFLSLVVTIMWVISIANEDMTKEDRDNIEFP